MNILVSVDNKYLPHLKVMLASLKDFNSSEKIEVYLLNKHLKSKECDELTNYLKKNNILLHIIQIKNSLFDNVKVSMHFSIEIMYRLLATELLPQKLDRILWLDADIVINGNISELYNSDFEGAYACVCAGRGDYEEHKIKLDIPVAHQYFNSGVLLMNLNLMRTDRVFDKYISILNNYGDKLKYTDQDILNIAFCHKDDLKYFDQKIYNYQIGSLLRLSKKEYESVIKECRVIHFAASSKPWNRTYYNHFEKIYWKYACKDGRRLEYIKFCLTAPIISKWSRYRMWKKWGHK